MAAAPRNNFHLLRLVLAGLVIVSHAVELRDGNRIHEPYHALFGWGTLGSVAVNCFFILSGFLILQSWERTPRLGAYLAKRALRIYPAFLIASVLSIVAVGAVGGGPSYWSRLHLPTLVKGFVLLRKPVTPLVFPHLPYPEVDGSMWTISSEFRCYCLLALVGVLGLTRKRWVWPLMAAGCLAAWLHPQGLHWSVPSHLAQLLLGNLYILCGFVGVFSAGAAFYAFREHLKFSGASIVVATIVLFVAQFNAATAIVSWATAGAYLLFGLAFWQNPLLNKLRPRDDISYGLYLYGWPTQKILWGVWPTAPVAVHVVIALAVAALIGFASWKLVESPFLRLKPKANPWEKDTGLSPLPHPKRGTGALAPVQAAIPGGGADG